MTHENNEGSDNTPAYIRNIVQLSSRLLSARPLAYASEVGESIRPIVPKIIVRGAYGLSFAYVFYDIGKHYHLLKTRNDPHLQRKITDLSLWHASASIVTPAIVIHTIVKVAGKIPATSQYASLIGLMSIPFIIHPIDNITDKVLDNTLRKAKWD